MTYQSIYARASTDPTLTLADVDAMCKQLQSTPAYELRRILVQLGWVVPIAKSGAVLKLSIALRELKHTFDTTRPGFSGIGN